jgi:hypothetical protein
MPSPAWGDLTQTREGVTMSFAVTDHLDLGGRGAVVVGHILEGVLGAGMRVATYADPPFLTLRSVEAVDNVREKKSWSALVFEERPTLDFVRRTFPVGGVLEAR